MVKLTARQVAAMGKDDLKKWLTDRDQKLPKTDHNKSYYIERVLEYQSAHENDDSDVDMGPRVRKSNRSTPSRLVNKRKTPIRSRRHSEMPSNNQTPTNQPIKIDARMTRSRRRTLDPGELHAGESVTRSRSRTKVSRKKKGLFLPKPAKDMKKTELQDWLSKNDIPYSSSMLKSDLMQLVMLHSMAPPDTPPKKARLERPTPAQREGVPPAKRSPKRQLEDKTNPNAKRMRHSYRSEAMQGLLDSTDDDEDGDSKVDDVQAPVTPKHDGPLPPNLDMSPLTPQQPQNTVEKQGSSSPPMGMQSHNDSMLSTPAFLRNVRRHGPKQITDNDRYQIRSEIRGLLDEVEDPNQPIVSTYKSSRRRSSTEHKEDPPVTRSLNFRDFDDSDADDEKTDVMKTRLPDPPPAMIRHTERQPTKKMHRRASEPIDIIPHQRIEFNPKTMAKAPATASKKKGSSALNWVLGAVVVGVLAFMLYVFFSLETSIRFCDTNSDTVGGLKDVDDNPLPCTRCPDRADCEQGLADCGNQYVLMGTRCVLNEKVVRAAYQVQGYVTSILAEVRGRHECGEDIEKGYSEDRLRDLVLSLFADDEGTLSTDAFDYFKENILPEISSIQRDGGLYVSRRPVKTVGCQMREWASDNKLLVCLATFFLLAVLVGFAKYRRSRRNKEMALNLKTQVMECLFERARSGRQDRFFSIDFLKNELKPPGDHVWNMVVEMMRYEHNVVKREAMVNGVQRSCWEMTDVPVARRHQRASLDPQMMSQWRPQNNHPQHHPNMHLSAPGQMPTWQGGHQAHQLGGNFGNVPQAMAPQQQEGLSQPGDAPAGELFQQHRRQTEANRQQEFTGSQGDGEHQGQGFQFGSRFPVSSAGMNF